MSSRFSTAESGTRASGKAPSTSKRTTKEEDEDAMDVVSRSVFDELRKETIDDAISEAGSDEEEVIPLDDTVDVREQLSSSGGGAAAAPEAEEDELGMLKEETPMKRLQERRRAARKARRDGDLWEVVRLHQEILGISKMYAPRAVYGDENQYPMLVSDAHFQLAKAYAELKCVQQANDHCTRALEAMPTYGMPHEQIQKFRLDTNIMLAEMLLTSKPPKPRAALQYVYAAAEATSSDTIQDLGSKVLASQCHGLMGSAKLEEAAAARSAHEALEQKIVVLNNQLAAQTRKGTEYEKIRKRIRETEQELSEEEQFMSSLLQEARLQLNQSSELLMEVIADEEGRMRNKVPDYKKHPLIQTLWRQATQLLFKLSLVEALDGKVQEQLVLLKEIASAEAEYGCVPLSLQARALKEQGACLVAKANGMPSGEDQDECLKQALETYNSLLELQASRFEDDEAGKALARAETLKLLGNVDIAMRHWNRAQENFQEALDIYSSYKGPNDLVVQDLEHRLREVAAYVEDD